MKRFLRQLSAALVPSIALYAAFMRLVVLGVLGYSRQLKRPLAASTGLVWPCACVPLHYGITAAARGYYLVHSRSIGKATATQEKSE